MAWEVGTPKLYMTPGIVGVPLDVKSDGQITMLANFITLTPGTLSLDVSEDKKVLYVYSMYITNREDFIKGIKNGFEKRIIEISFMTLDELFILYNSSGIITFDPAGVFPGSFMGPTISDRVVAVDLLVTIGIGIIAVYSILTHQPTFLDIALILALNRLFGNSAYSFYIQKRKNK